MCSCERCIFLFETPHRALDRTVLLAIVYVLSRTENLQCPEVNLANLDLGEIRAQRLGQTPPHVIECVEAGEGKIK